MKNHAKGIESRNLLFLSVVLLLNVYVLWFPLATLYNVRDAISIEKGVNAL